MAAKLDGLRQRAVEAWERLQSSPQPRVTVGTATCGRSAGALEALEAFRSEARSRGMELPLTEVGCIGLCYAEPIVCITKPPRPPVYYGGVTADRARDLFHRYLVGDDPAAEYALGTSGEGSIDGIPPLAETPVFRRQVRRTLANCGLIDPTNIHHYLARGGYAGLAAALERGAEGVIAEVKRSGLRGRGGAGFPTWRKWQFARQAADPEKYLICNASEGDPGAFSNKLLLESDPHSVLEGILIAAFAIGASHGYLYCPSDYPLALDRLEQAVADLEDAGLLGDAVLGSSWGFHLKLKRGAGAYVCGEETGLIECIEGHRGSPRCRPPFPPVAGLWNHPTIVNNVETLACVTQVLREGPEEFARLGTAESQGTKTVCLSGNVKRPGVVEVPFGVTLKEIVWGMGGGTADGGPVKAIFAGGPGGGFLPARLDNLPLEQAALVEHGAAVGSGGLVVVGQDSCMVDLARNSLEFAFAECCGQCTPCRLGTKQLLSILEDICAGRGRAGDVELLVELSQGIQAGSLCGLGQTAPNPVLTTIRYFRDEYDAHVNRKRCPAVVCTELISSPCQHICPIGTEAPVYIAHIAQGRFQEAFAAIAKDNPLPAVCARVCHHPCESGCQAGQWGDAVAVRALKRFAVDYALESGFHPPARRRQPRGPKVAIVGSGPAGLMAGYQLANRGYGVTIFEAMDVAGGALAAYIPEYRLPKRLLEADIENVRAAGVEIRTGVKVGRDIPFEDLVDQYRAVFVATGAHRSRKLHIPGEDLEGVIDAMEFLRDVNLRREVRVGPRVGVIGGGNSAVDAARVAVRLASCREVTIIYRRTRAEMPAFEEEVDGALEEGVRLEYLAAPTRVLGSDGKMTAVECVRMQLGEPDESGRRRPVPIEGSEFTIELDTLLVAVGEQPDLSFAGRGQGLEVSERGTTVVCEETMATSLPGVFAGGDVVTGPDTVVNAMAAGKLAAEMIDRHVRGEPLVRQYEPIRPSQYVPPVELSEAEAEAGERVPVPHAPVSEALSGFAEVEGTLSPEQAIREARRCLRCDLQTADAKQWMATRANQPSEGGCGCGR